MDGVNLGWFINSAHVHGLGAVNYCVGYATSCVA